MRHDKAFHQIADLIDITAQRHPAKDAFRYMEHGDVVTSGDRKGLTGVLLWQWLVNFAGHLVRLSELHRIGVQMPPSTQTHEAIYGNLLFDRPCVSCDLTSRPSEVVDFANQLSAQIETAGALIQHIWSRVFRINIVDRDDNFFELEGSSLSVPGSCLSLSKELDNNLIDKFALMEMSTNRPSAAVAHALSRPNALNCTNSNRTWS